MKKVWIIMLAVFLLASTAVAGEIGRIKVKSGWTGSTGIDIQSFNDPDNPFVTIFLTSVSDSRIGSTADPSNSCIAARMTGVAPLNKEGKLNMSRIKTNQRDDVFTKSKSWFSKTMKVSRFYDAPNKTLIYVVFVRKGLTSGSVKHSMSVVPLR